MTVKPDLELQEAVEKVRRLDEQVELGWWDDWSVVLADAVERFQAELQAAQEREKTLLEAMEFAIELPYKATVILREALAAQRTEEPSDDEGLEPIETSPLTEREPDL